MIILYFSGTGNSKYIAELFSSKMKCPCHSIEEDLNFKELVAKHETIVFCYPIYGSRVPRIMREFIRTVFKELENKKIIIFCTQLLFSGDGARAFTDLFPRKYFQVIYAEHFCMPNNISDFKIFPITNGEKNRKYIIRARKKMNRICRDIKKGIIRKKGFHLFSKLLGLSQGLSWPKLEARMASAWRADNSCNGCRICEKLCPVNNLEWNGRKMVQKNNCVICFRCVNKCPKRAITILSRSKVKEQYTGIYDLFIK